MLESNKFELRKYANDLSGLYGIRDIIFTSGRSKGMKAVELRSDKGIELTVLTDRCLDIPYLSYKGINLSLTSKVGLVAPEYFVDDGGVMGFLKQFNLGTLTTCGLLHSGPPDTRDGRQFGLHGTIGNTPGENISTYEEVIKDEVVLTVSAEIRQAIHGMEYLVLKRKLQLFTEQNLIKISDEIENRGFETQAIKVQYHSNFGYPLLDEGAKMYFSARSVEPCFPDDWNHLDERSSMKAAEVGNADDVMFCYTEVDKNAFAMLHNEKLGLAQVVHYDGETLPVLLEWIHRQAGNYSLGLEPSICGCYNYEEVKRRGWAKYLAPGEVYRMTVAYEVLDNQEKIQEYISRCPEQVMK